jgi:hypothetical protein
MERSKGLGISRNKLESLNDLVPVYTGPERRKTYLQKIAEALEERESTLLENIQKVENAMDEVNQGKE